MEQCSHPRGEVPQGMRQGLRKGFLESCMETELTVTRESKRAPWGGELGACSRPSLQRPGKNVPPLLRVSVAGSGVMGAQACVLGTHSVWWPGQGLGELIHETRPSCVG